MLRHHSAIRLTLLLLLLLESPFALAQDYLPEHDSVPGAIKLRVTQDNLRQTVCVHGWTATIRPSSAYIRTLKARQMRDRGLSGTTQDYHEDHLVPLCAGGHPTDRRNLWPQPLEGKWRDADKNQLEQSVCRALCRGAVTLEEAQALFLAPD